MDRNGCLQWLGLLAVTMLMFWGLVHFIDPNRNLGYSQGGAVGFLGPGPSQ